MTKLFAVNITRGAEAFGITEPAGGSVSPYNGTIVP
jgi:hypothetical protein